MLRNGNATPDEDAASGGRKKSCVFWAICILLLVVLGGAAAAAALVLSGDDSSDGDDAATVVDNNNNDNNNTEDPLLQQASVRLVLQPVQEKMSAAHALALEAACTDFFSNVLPEFSNVTATVTQQKLIATQQQLVRRTLQESSMALEVFLLVQGRHVVLSSSSEEEGTTTSENELLLTTELLTEQVVSNEGEFLSILQQKDESFWVVDAYFDTIERVLVGETTNAAASIPSTTTTTMAPTPAPTPSGPRRCNGLANLCDQPVNEILFATMHNANSYVGSVPTWLANHQQDMLQALAAGIRGLNMDVGKCASDNGEPQLALVHGFCGLGFTDPAPIWTDILKFLLANPNEVLLLPTQINEDTGGAVPLQEIYDLMKNKVVVVKGDTSISMADLLYTHPGPGTPWPTVGELIDRNQRILFFHYNGASCRSESAECPTGFHDWFVYAAETEFQFGSADEILNDIDQSCKITRGGSGTRDFFGVNMFLQLPSEDAAQTLNARETLRQHLMNCQEAQSDLLRPSLVVVDFFGKGDIIETVREWNANL